MPEPSPPCLCMPHQSSTQVSVFPRASQLTSEDDAGDVAGVTVQVLWMLFERPTTDAVRTGAAWTMRAWRHWSSSRGVMPMPLVHARLPRSRVTGRGLTSLDPVEQLNPLLWTARSIYGGAYLTVYQWYACVRALSRSHVLLPGDQGASDMFVEADKGAMTMTSVDQPTDADASAVTSGGPGDHTLDSGISADVALENARWVAGLSPGSPNHPDTVDELYNILLRMAYSEAGRRGARIQLAGPELDDVAHQAAADAALSICRKVSTFRGECRFTTWAFRFVAFDVSSKVNRHHWQRASLSIDDNEWALRRPDQGNAPEDSAVVADLLAAVRRIVREELTERQRKAFEGIALLGLSVSQVAQDLDSNPNAVYKTMFDARRKVRSSLVSGGYLHSA